MEIQYRTIDEYIDTFPTDIQTVLKRMRQTIREAAPEALETISYQMPTFKLNGNLVYFAANKNHIGFYPTPSGIEQFKTELSEYKGSKGALQFPLVKPIPFDLVKKIVTFGFGRSRRRKGLLICQAKGQAEVFIGTAY